MIQNWVFHSLEVGFGKHDSNHEKSWFESWASLKIWNLILEMWFGPCLHLIRIISIFLFWSIVVWFEPWKNIWFLEWDLEMWFESLLKICEGVSAQDRVPGIIKWILLLNKILECLEIYKGVSAQDHISWSFWSLVNYVQLKLNQEIELYILIVNYKYFSFDMWLSFVQKDTIKIHIARQ